jgi:hypothetical protein
MTIMNLTWSQMRVAAATVALLAIVGCGSSRDMELIPVSGTITFAGGPPPKPGTITFSPISTDEGVPKRPGSASFAEDGTFEVTSFEEGDGLAPGTYSVKVTCWQQPPSEDDPTSFQRFNLVPDDFTHEVVVATDADQVDVPIDVPKKGAQAR